MEVNSRKNSYDWLFKTDERLGGKTEVRFKEAVLEESEFRYS